VVLENNWRSIVDELHQDADPAPRLATAPEQHTRIQIVLDLIAHHNFLLGTVAPLCCSAPMSGNGTIIQWSQAKKLTLVPSRLRFARKQKGVMGSHFSKDVAFLISISGAGV